MKLATLDRMSVVRVAGKDLRLPYRSTRRFSLDNALVSINVVRARSLTIRGEMFLHCSGNRE